MDGGGERMAAGEAVGQISSAPASACKGMPLWLIAALGLALSLGLAVSVALSSGRTAPLSSAPLLGSTSPLLGSTSWWQDSIFLAILGAGLVVTALFTAIIRHFYRAQDEGHRRLNDIVQALARMDGDSHSIWGMLKEQKIIDGHAIWNKDDRLIDCSGFLIRYLPQLAEWRQPTGRQIITALVESGQLVLPGGGSREQTIEIKCRLHQETPGLSEFHMADGQIFLVRMADFGTGHRTSIFTNITELKRRHLAYGIEDKAFRDAFESATPMLALLDARMHPLTVNRAFRTTLGRSVEDWPVEDWPMEDWKSILHPDDRAETVALTAGTRRFLGRDGSVLRGKVRFTPIRDDDGAPLGHTLMTVEDVTARWESDDKIRLQARLLDQIGNAVLAVDGQGLITYGNQAALALFQWSDAVLSGTPVERLLGGAVRHAMESGKTEVETDGIPWNGNRFPAQIIITRIVGAIGEAAGTVLVVTDLTPRRALDLQLIHSARLATLGEMAASIAHEFNQCLHVIRLSAEALQLDLDEGALDCCRVAKRSGNILSQVDRLTEMVTHMRTISRREESRKYPFHPQAALETALRMVEPLLAADGIKLVRHGRLDGLCVLGHQVRLEQVLLNLLNNARDAIGERFRRDGNTGGTITVVCHGPDGSMPSRVRIVIRDDGTGVPDKLGRHMFEPFVTTKDSGRGCGLGLSISLGICTEMGGCLMFHNVEAGAEFTIELPLSETEAPPPPGAFLPHGGNETPEDDDDFSDERRILLVDDEALSVMMAAEFLQRQGYVVDTAYDGVEAVGKIKSQIYHAVITDIRMPRMNGHEVIARLEELQPGTPVIVVTAHLQEDNAAELGGSVVALLSKPFQLQDLRDQLLKLDTDTAIERQPKDV